MDIKLKSGLKLKLKDVSLDERDEMLDGVQYETDSDGKTTGMKMMHSTITKWLRIGLDGDTSDEFLKKLSFEDITEVFLKMHETLLMGEEKASV